MFSFLRHFALIVVLVFSKEIIVQFYWYLESSFRDFKRNTIGFFCTFNRRFLFGNVYLQDSSKLDKCSDIAFTLMILPSSTSNSAFQINLQINTAIKMRFLETRTLKRQNLDSVFPMIVF